MSRARPPVDRSSPLVAVLGHVGRQNMGDEAIFEALFAGLRRTIPGVRLIAFTTNPADTLTRHGVDTYPIRPNSGPVPPGRSNAPRSRPRLAGALKRIPPIRLAVRAARAAVTAVRAAFKETRFAVRSYLTLRHVDLVVIAGSAQVADFWGGPVGYPWTLLRWTLLGRLVGARVAFVSNGCGPIDHRLSRLFLRAALRLSSYRSFRDASSAALARTALQAPAKSCLVRDLAFSLPELLPRASLTGARTRPVVGVNVLPYCSGLYWYDVDEAKHQHYLDVHADAVARIIDQGFDVVMLATHPLDPVMSRQVVDRVAARSPSARTHLRIPAFVPEVQDTLALIRSCDIVLAARYHGLLLSIAQGVPVIGVSYHPKTDDLLRSVGLSEFCIDIDAVESGQLVAMVDRAWGSIGELRRRIVRELPAVRAEVGAQYGELALLARGHWITRPAQKYVRKAATVSTALFDWTAHEGHRTVHK